MKKHYPLIILGSGPAGCTAAIYAARANLKPAIIAGLEQGGQLVKTSVIENWPGEDQGISGFSLMENMINQAKRFGSEIISDSIYEANLMDRPFYLKGYDDNEYTCDGLIVATGSIAKSLDIQSEQTYIGRGVSVCALCDGSFYKNKKVVVVGGGNSAFEDAIYLAKLASEVTIIHRRSSFRADHSLVERLKKMANVKFELDCIVEEILGNGSVVSGIRIKNISLNVVKELGVDGVFVAIGYKPNTEIFVGQLEMEQGYIKTGYNAAVSATNIKGVFAAGDVISRTYHQAITAAASGCVAALDIKNFFYAE